MAELSRSQSISLLWVPSFPEMEKGKSLLTMAITTASVTDTTRHHSLSPWSTGATRCEPNLLPAVTNCQQQQLLSKQGAYSQHHIAYSMQAEGPPLQSSYKAAHAHLIIKGVAQPSSPNVTYPDWHLSVNWAPEGIPNAAGLSHSPTSSLLFQTYLSPRMELKSRLLHMGCKPL